ncbi:Mn2+/Fe2+ transporter [Caballeronia pedi]|uniref:Mn2+/Fe2+ transporter n=1 Tax=Caballeronia pedi TaxID=1777141 RepID=A0A158E4M1_9BURK|nr:divalent metal cation transporter [Caballeronia pedi]SAL01754.1 Mn2+/Fe2+ transporter [Caballeronia pedi]
MATDLAEFFGGAIALAPLFTLPLMAGMATTAVVAFGILLVEKKMASVQWDLSSAHSWARSV